MYNVISVVNIEWKLLDTSAFTHEQLEKEMEKSALFNSIQTRNTEGWL